MVIERKQFTQTDTNTTHSQFFVIDPNKNNNKPTSTFMHMDAPQ